MADASELSPARQVAQGTGKAAGKAFKASSGIPSLADDGTDRQLSHRNSSTVSEGDLCGTGRGGKIGQNS